jgi:hypothetical protein
VVSGTCLVVSGAALVVSTTAGEAVLVVSTAEESIVPLPVLLELHPAIAIPATAKTVKNFNFMGFYFELINYAVLINPITLYKCIQKKKVLIK